MAQPQVLQVRATARKLKVTTVLDAAPFAALRQLPDNAAQRTEITVEVGAQRLSANIATKSLRRAVAAIAEHGPDGIVLLLQGTLTAADRLEEAGLSAQVKAKPAEQQAA